MWPPRLVTAASPIVGGLAVLTPVEPGELVPQPDSPQLGDYFDEWILRRVHRAAPRTTAPTTVHGYRKVIDQKLRPHLGDRPLSELNRREPERTYARLLASGGVGGRPLAAPTV